jgi:hypothetical protein
MTFDAKCFMPSERFYAFWCWMFLCLLMLHVSIPSDAINVPLILELNILIIGLVHFYNVYFFIHKAKDRSRNRYHFSFPGMPCHTFVQFFVPVFKTEAVRIQLQSSMLMRRSIVYEPLNKVLYCVVCRERVLAQKVLAVCLFSLAKITNLAFLPTRYSRVRDTELT